MNKGGTKRVRAIQVSAAAVLVASMLLTGCPNAPLDMAKQRIAEAVEEKLPDKAITQLEKIPPVKTAFELLGIEAGGSSTDQDIEAETEASIYVPEVETETESDVEVETSSSIYVPELDTSDLAIDEVIELESGILNLGYCTLDVSDYFAGNLTCKRVDEDTYAFFSTYIYENEQGGLLFYIMVLEEDVYNYSSDLYLLGSSDRGFIAAVFFDEPAYDRSNYTNEFIFTNLRNSAPTLLITADGLDRLPKDWAKTLKSFDSIGSATEEGLERSVYVFPKACPEGVERYTYENGSFIDETTGKLLVKAETVDDYALCGTWLLDPEIYNQWTKESREEMGASGQMEPWLVLCKDGRAILNSTTMYKVGKYYVDTKVEEEEYAVIFFDDGKSIVYAYQGDFMVHDMPEVEYETGGSDNTWYFKFQTKDEWVEPQEGL